MRLKSIREQQFVMEELADPVRSTQQGIAQKE
jgi:hypothetical protein